MKLIVGLGNPKDTYKDSRHNIGFSVVKSLAKTYKISFRPDKGTFSLSGKGKRGPGDILLAMPLTFMNLSGTAVAGLVKKYKIDLADLLIVCDDLDLEFGRLKIRPSGSSGGHRGLKSIIDALKSTEFARLRLGIGRPPHQLISKHTSEANGCGGKVTDVSEYVLSCFSRKEKAEVKKMLDKAGLCCEAWAKKGITEAMNIFNKRSKVNG